MRLTDSNQQDIPLNIVGSSTFGIYPKISVEKTYNMFITDNWLTTMPGYSMIQAIGSFGRGVFFSSRANLLFLIVDDKLYSVDINNQVTFLNQISTFIGPIWMAENERQEIGISDGLNVYVYNYVTQVMQLSFTPPGPGLDFLPGYLAYQTGSFVVAANGTPTWRLSDPQNPNQFPSILTGSFEYGDEVQAVVPMPGAANVILIMGKIVSQYFTNYGLQLFPYRENTNQSINYGTINPATVATGDDIVVWLAGNSTSSPVIMYTKGGPPQTISSDGINNLLETLKHLQTAYGFIFKVQGHLFYVLTSPRDNVSLMYDFTTEKFFHLSDQNQNYYIARQMAYFNGTHYFISNSDGTLYELNQKYQDLNGSPQQQIRTCKAFFLPDGSNFIANRINFTVEQGDINTVQRIDLTLSYDGGQSFGNPISYNMNNYANRRNRLDFWSLGYANYLIPQFRFWGDGRFLATDGFMTVQS